MKVRETIVIVALATCCLLSSCGNRRGAHHACSQDSRKDSTEFTMIKVPTIINDEQQRRDYIVSHYWEHLSEKFYAEQVEKQFSNWIWLSERTDINTAGNSLIQAYQKSPQRILHLSEKYLYDPQSPYRNEDLYGRLAAYIGGDLAQTAKLCALNAVGTRAADFLMEDARGHQFTLYSIKAPYTLLFFSNPYCNACKEIIETLKGSDLVSDALNNKILMVVNMYIDEDLEQWRSYLGNYPRIWRTAYDPTFTLRDSEKYNIRAIPSLYLLDDNKVVLLKDAPTDKIMARLAIEFKKYPQFEKYYENNTEK